MAEISAKVVKELRDQTGAGMMDCKRALSESNGDIEQAKDWLRKRGQAIADKKSARKASEGLIFTHISEDARIGVMLELNCETDFVARNEAFVKLGTDIARHVAAGGAGTTGGVEELLESGEGSPLGGKLGDVLRQNIATLGENIGVGGFVRVESKEPHTHLQTYIHPPGKLGVLLEVTTDKSDSLQQPAFKELARDIAMHIAAASPQFLGRSTVDQDKLEREKGIYRDQAINEGKGEKFLEKIVEGRVGKFYKEACLLEQEFVKNPDETITQLVGRIGKELGDNVKLVGFQRMKVGS